MFPSKYFKASFLLIFIVLFCFINALNPITQNVYTADPACLVHNETFFIYTGHDTDNTKVWFNMVDWLCFSSTDMQNWVNHGVVLSAKDFSWAPPNGAWAAQVIERSGKFYYYVTLSGGDGSQIGVAVADSPLGPFKDALGKPLINGPSNYIDPTVYIDDDGQAYLYFGNGKLWYVKLNEDMISYSGNIVQAELNNMPTMYDEAPWFYKNKEKNFYYMVYACSGIPQDICYSTSSSPTGPWKYAGIIMPKNQQGFATTIHPAVCDYQNRNYFVYHTAKLPGGGDFTRAAAIEEFNYNNEGKFPEILFSGEGPQQIKYLDPFQKHLASTINFEEGIEVYKNPNGNPRIADVRNGSYIKIKGADFGEGAKKFTAYVASETEGGKIEIKADKKDGKNIGVCEVKGTGDWNSYITVECEVDIKDVHDIYFVFTGGEGFLFDVEWWQFE